MYYLDMRGLTDLYNDHDYKLYKRKAGSGGNEHTIALQIVDMLILNAPVSWGSQR